MFFRVPTRARAPVQIAKRDPFHGPKENLFRTRLNHRPRVARPGERQIQGDRRAIGYSPLFGGDPDAGTRRIFLPSNPAIS